MATARRTALVPILALAGPGAAAILDDFDDNARGSAWKLVQDDPALALAETNQRLEAIAAAPSNPAFDALYLSSGASGFRLATDTDFRVTLGYAFNGFTAADPATGEGLALALGVGRDLDGTDSAAVAYGVGRVQPAGLPFGLNVLAGGVASRTEDAESVEGAFPTQASTGSFEIVYDAAGDDLTLGFAGTANQVTLQDRVRGIWGADSLLVSFGARGSGFALASGQAFLDDFRVESGRVLPVPEPAGAAVLLTSGLVVLQRRRFAGRRCQSADRRRSCFETATVRGFLRSVPA